MYLEDSIGLYNAYLDAIRRPHGYLIFDMIKDMDDGLRFRTNISPTEYHTVVYSDIGDEACDRIITPLTFSRRPNRDCVKP